MGFFKIENESEGQGSVKFFFIGLAVWILAWFAEKLLPESFTGALSLDDSKKVVSLINILGHLFTDISVAIWVAIIVGWLIEDKHRKSLRNAFDNFLSEFDLKNSQARQSISKDVFLEAFSTEYPFDYKNEVINLAFGGKVMRKQFRIDYILSELDDNYKNNKTDSLILSCKVMHQTINCSTKQINVPKLINLPSPQIPALFPLVKVRSFKVGATNDSLNDLTDAELSAANGRLFASLSAGQLNPAFDAGEVMIKPGEHIFTEISYDLIKEVEDSEIFRTLYPSDGIQIMVLDSTKNRNLFFSGQQAHPSPLTESTHEGGEGKVNRFTLGRYFIPYQGITIFWKRKSMALNGEVNDAISGLVS